MQIKSKRDMYELYKKGKFGNSLRAWNSVAEMKAEKFKGMVGIRHTSKSGGKLATLPNVPAHMAHAALVLHGIENDPVVIQEGAPDERLICQGEAMLGIEGLEIRISFKKCKMREAMSDQTIRLTGLIAKCLLKSVLTPASYDDLMELLEIYDSPDLHGAPNRSTVIEFGTYTGRVGAAKGRNGLVWEVRAY